ncbi:hypothetical protein [Tabrizicola sp.]|uniref:hypothetical protein n=1 Tax=Tabrizicola sp. TaxID=2005166 RepID=UPI003F3E184D
MLRLLIGTGLLLMAVGFGAAGWQYWQAMPGSEASGTPEAETAAPARDRWLISPTGGLVPQTDVQAYLVQDRYVPSRTVLVTREASLNDLLAEGETLPETAYLQVLADIRAPRVAEGLCALLLQSIASDCAVNAARVVEGSVDPDRGTAMFRLELVYRLANAEAELPDLAANVFGLEVLDLEVPSEGSATADAALAAILQAATDACAAEGRGQLCRPLRFSLNWVPGQPVTARAELGWLDPLPEGMFVAPPLEPASGG